MYVHGQRECGDECLILYVCQGDESFENAFITTVTKSAACASYKVSLENALIFICVRIYVCVYMCAYICVRIYVCVYMCAYI